MTLRPTRVSQTRNRVNAPHRPRYVEVIQDTLGETVRRDYDIIALCEATLDDGLQPRFVVATAKAAEAAERLVGPLEMHVLIAVR
jgi:hypothetical protein